MEYWEKEALKAKNKKDFDKKYPYFGKKVRRKGIRKWEYGVVVIHNFEGEEPEEFIEYAEDDREQLCCLPFQYWDEVSSSWIEA